ncbi:MAG: ribonuclease H-like domain-containing protein, partial [Actinobacteria bacterium]|nr:ribonuclease H-like domain-containing protein [Actinomycetota bacterium]
MNAGRVTHALSGCDPTTRIVGVEADASGRARVWRRLDHGVELIEQRFPNWFLTTSLDLLDHLPARIQNADWLRANHGRVSTSEPLVVVDLDLPPGVHDDAYRFLVLTTNLRETETTLLETASKRFGDEAGSLHDLRGLVLTWDPVEQFLMLSGQTFFKDMSFDGLHRFQFDLETTGLNEDRDRIFMISMFDSTGWHACLDTLDRSEDEVLRRFVQIVRERDPDVLENHNIFGFDLAFLARRAGRLGVELALGRDGSEPRLETDVFDSGERAEPFLRWRVAGRQVIDTQHAVRQFAVRAPDMRRHGLKDAARYFGFARGDREYVPGAEIWSTFQSDPDRVRRYAADDVEEVDGLSRRLLPAGFELAQLLPRSYERVAADTGAAALWEPLLVRAYLHEGHAIVAPRPRVQHLEPARAELLVSGMVGPAVRANAHPLLPCILADRQVASANDVLGVMPVTMAELLAQGTSAGPRQLSSAAHTCLASPGLFTDPDAAAQASAIARQYMTAFLEDL